MNRRPVDTAVGGRSIQCVVLLFPSLHYHNAIGQATARDLCDKNSDSEVGLHIV